MLPLVLAFGSGMAWGTADFLGGLSARTLPLVTVSLVSQAAGLAFLVIVAVAGGEGPSDVERSSSASPVGSPAPAVCPPSIGHPRSDG